MKKVIVILSIYTLLVFLCCIGETYIYRSVPELVPECVSSYRFYRGISWFLSLLPSILISGFCIACSIQWKRNATDSRRRFSPAMIDRYRFVIIISLVFVFILSFSAEIGRPIVNRKLAAFENGPVELENDLKTAETFLAEEKYDLAYIYARRASAVAPRNAEALGMLKRTKDALEIYNDRAMSDDSFVTVDEEEKPLYAQDHSYSVKELIARARKAYEAEEWFNAHYWATLAIDACKGVDTNLDTAHDIADKAWNILRSPSRYESSELNLIFAKKQKGYFALSSGDYLQAYYIFLELQKNIIGADPDVERFFALAKEGMENQYFFIDETQNMDLLSNGHNVYFSLKNPDGTKSVYFIKSLMDSKDSGKSVRYLKNLTIVKYDRKGNFINSVNVPIAKVVSQSTSVFDDDSKKILGIDKTWKTVPYLMMLAVDRNTQGLVSRPSYRYAETGLPLEIMEEEELVGLAVDVSKIPPAQEVSDYAPNTAILPMPYADFASINMASESASAMTIFSLMHFIPNAVEYGFSAEVFRESLVSRLMYPLFILILFVFAASAGWNYRIENSSPHFKTSWLFIILLFGLIMYLIVEMAVYMFNIVNYVLVGTFNQASLVAAAVVYVTLFVGASFYFMSRKA